MRFNGRSINNKANQLFCRAIHKPSISAKMIYEALQDGCPPRQTLMQEYVKHIPDTEDIVLAGDHTACICKDTTRSHIRTSAHNNRRSQTHNSRTGI